MARIILITGGARSGKSGYAQKLAEDLPGSRVFVATCPPIDEEMEARIDRHRKARRGRGWKTREAPVALEAALREAREDVVLVDCLTLWVNNLMYGAEQAGGEVTEEAVRDRCLGLMRAAREREGTVVFVTNEVGMGIVPEHPSARRYRDLVGRCNQVVAAGADRVVWMVSGIPVDVKGGRRAIVPGNGSGD